MRKRFRFDLRKALFILPNLFTLSSIFCGFYAMLLAAQYDASGDVAMLMKACICILAAFPIWHQHAIKTRVASYHEQRQL